MQQRRAQLGGDLGDVAGAFAVDAHRHVRLAFGLVDRGVGGRVDDDVAARGAQRRQDHVANRQIELRPAERDDLDPTRRALDHRADDLPVQSGDD
jgi:hypothetical protein